MNFICYEIYSTSTIQINRLIARNSETTTEMTKNIASVAKIKFKNNKMKTNQNKMHVSSTQLYEIG